MPQTVKTCVGHVVLHLRLCVCYPNERFTAKLLKVSEQTGKASVSNGMSTVSGGSSRMLMGAAKDSGSDSNASVRGLL